MLFILFLIGCDDYITPEPNHDTAEVFCIHPEEDTGTTLCCTEWATSPDDCWEE